ncbi:MAG: D-alanine--D-alanine ligase family protein [Candidatus Saccharimonadaceae bacterium]
MQYLVLGGGISPEKDVSTRSATAVQQALEHLGHTVVYQDPEGLSMEKIVQLAKSTDGVFPILHGVGGEDGSIQAYLEKENIPYFGPSAASCDTTFDKDHFKRILEKNDVPTPKWNVVSADQFATEPLTKGPFVLKPINGGSSIDTFIIRSLPFDDTPLLEALSRYGTMLIEECISGTEITVGVLEDTALPVIEIIPPENQDFDYENKYNGATQELCPPKNVSLSLQEKAQALALAAHKATNCRHLSRTDILINSTGELFVIDTNTIPGLTNQSLFPKAAATAGYDWTALVEQFTQLIK